MDELPLGWGLILIENGFEVGEYRSDLFELSPLTCFEISVFVETTNCFEGESQIATILHPTLASIYKHWLVYSDNLRQMTVKLFL